VPIGAEPSRGQTAQVPNAGSSQGADHLTSTARASSTDDTGSGISLR
jgi:hypothetical protein